MPLISHEIPKTLFPVHDLICDYPYVLGHLLNKDRDYTEFYRGKLADSPFSILDNSAFELGQSIPMYELSELGKEFKPTHLVLPDKVNDHAETIENAKEYLSKYKIPQMKYIGVCQGNTFVEIANCIDYYADKVDIIALPFDLVPDSDYITVRFRFLNWWYANRFNYSTNGNYKFHLLGCQNPVEFLLYKYNQNHISKYIYSIDTSSPIINGWNNLPLTDHGLIGSKPKEKLADNLDIKLSLEQLFMIFKNVKKFREYVNN